MMVVGYLILAGVAMDEQALGGPGTESVPRSGAIQAWLFFIAGIALAVGVLLDVQPLLGLNLLGEVAGVIIVLVRLRRAISGAGWPAASDKLHAAASLIFSIPALAILGYLIVKYAEDFEAVPRELIIALDHATFIGILTNSIFALLLVATAYKRDLWAWADNLVLWGINLALAAFIGGLLAEKAGIKQVATPIMGASILLGLLTAAMRMRAEGNASVAGAG